MKDLLGSSLKFQSRHYLVFHLLSLILYHKQDYLVFNPVSLILYPNSVLNPLSKRHSESKMDEKKDFLKKTQEPFLCYLKKQRGGCVQIA